MPKSEFLGRHFKCDACGAEIEGRSDHNLKFQGWFEVRAIELHSGKSNYKIFCPVCAELRELVIADAFGLEDPTNPPLEQPIKGELSVSGSWKLPKHSCQRCKLIFPDGKGLKHAAPSAGEWKNKKLCTACRVELNELHTKGVNCVPVEPASAL